MTTTNAPRTTDADLKPEVFDDYGSFLKHVIRAYYDLGWKHRTPQPSGPDFPDNAAVKMLSRDRVSILIASLSKIFAASSNSKSPFNPGR